MVQRATALGLSAIAITDHDTVEGVMEGMSAASAAGIAFLSGVEISGSFVGNEVHVVGLGVDVGHAHLLDALKMQIERRNRRAREIIEKLHALGIPVAHETVEARTAGGIVGRMHIAQEIHELGFSATVQDAFDRYIGAGGPAYVRKAAMSVAEAIDVIHAAGGLAFLAHPGIGRTMRVLTRLMRLPFDGIEAYHCKHGPEQTKEFIRYARERGLLIAGGSDCHGQAKMKPEMGTVLVPYEHFASIGEALNDATRRWKRGDRPRTRL